MSTRSERVLATLAVIDRDVVSEGHGRRARVRVAATHGLADSTLAQTLEAIRDTAPPPEEPPA